MNVAFFGTSDRSIPILEALKKHFNLTLCVTKNDAKAGRHLKLKETEVKRWAVKNRVKYLTIGNLNTETTAKVIEHILDSKITMGVMADFSFIIPDAIIITPKYKIINIHFSLLPKYRGASPVQFAILNSDNKTGTTYYIMDKGMDTGDIIHQSEHALNQSETSGQLYKILFEQAAVELPNVIDSYVQGKSRPTKQNHENASYTYSPTHPKNTFIFKEDAKIDWSQSDEKIERSVRAYNPWPIAWTTLGELANVFKLPLKEGKNPNPVVKLYEVKNRSGKLAIKSLQVENGRKISFEDFVNGFCAKRQ